MESVRAFKHSLRPIVAKAPYHNGSHHRWTAMKSSKTKHVRFVGVNRMRRCGCDKSGLEELSIDKCFG
jgi:hypothetical protein